MPTDGNACGVAAFLPDLVLGAVILIWASTFVITKDALDEAATHLDSLGIAHEGVKDIGAGYILEFRDPDNIALELMAPPAK